MANWCLLPEYVEKFKAGLRDGSIHPEKLASMDSAQRNKFFSDIIGKDNAVNVNSLFESKLLLKNQKAGYITWAKKVAGLSPEVRRDLISKIEKMDRILSPAEGEAFLKDLAQTRLGVGVSEQEAKQIFDLSTKVKETRALQKEDFTFPSEEARLAYGRSKVALMNYVNDLKSKTNLRPSLSPTKALSSVAGNAKSIKASMDNSAIFRQGWKTLLTNPVIWSKNAPKTFSDIYRTFGGKKVMDELNADILSRPSYDLMVKAKLAIGTIEEAFPGTIVEKVPVVGRAYKASENAYTGFLYRTRADVFDKYIQIAQKTGVELNNKELQAIGSMVNSLTGRGNLGRFEGSTANLLNNVFFSPRNLKSQFDTLGHVFTGAGGSNFVRKEAAINLVKVISGIAGILATANAIKPGSVEWDSRSADFGQIKVGNTRFNVSGGLNGLVVLASRLITGATKSSTTGAITPLNTGDYGKPTSTDVIYNFFENKLSPMAAMFRDLLNQKDFDGNKPTPESVAKNLFLPIGFSNFEDLRKDPNSPNAIITMILDGLGIGASTYLPKPQKENSWSDKPTKSQEAFLGKVGLDKFKEANQIYNLRYTEWQKQAEATDVYKNLSDDKKNGVNNSARQRIQDAVFKEYGFTYKEPVKTRKDLQQEKELEKIKPKKVSQSLLDKLIPPAYAEEDAGLLGSTTYETDFRTGKTTVTRNEGVIEKILKAITSLFDQKKEQKRTESLPGRVELKANPAKAQETPVPVQSDKASKVKVDNSNIQWLEDKVLPITRKAGLPDALVAGQWAIEDRKKDTSMFNLRIKGEVHKYQNIENNVNDYIRTVTNILKRKGYDINEIKDPQQILDILQTGDTRYEGHSKDPKDYVKITSETPEYKYYSK